MSDQHTKLRGLLHAAGCWLLPCAVLLYAQLHLLTYVTGQDPFTYVRLAQSLLAQRFSFNAWREVVSFVAPGYPALLAIVIAVAGPYATAWINLLLLIISFGLLVRLFRRWGLSPEAISSAGLIIVWLTFRGYSLNAHYLLYAFRGAAQFLLILLAYAVAGSADPAKRSGGARLAVATAILLLATTFRETAILAWPALALWLVWTPEWQGRRAKGLLWLIAPILPGLLLVGGLLLSGAWTGHAQANAWLARFTAGGRALFFARIADYARILWEELGWIGTALLALGAWHNRRRKNVLALWLIPAVLWICFYAGYRVHRRFFLDSLLMLAVVCGTGVAPLIAPLQRARAARMRRGLMLLLPALLLVLNGATVARLSMWGPRVRGSQVRRLLNLIANQPGTHDGILVDPLSKHLIEALTMYGGPRPINVLEDDGSGLVRDPPLLFVSSTNEQHAPSAKVGISPEDWLRQFADLQPVTSAGGEPATANLGDCVYAFHQVTPWSWHRIESPVQDRHVAGGLFWLDFRASDPVANRKVSWFDGGNRLLKSWNVPHGNGLIPFALAPGMKFSEGSRVVVESSAPLPEQLLPEPVHHRGFGYFRLGEGRLPSVMNWIVEPAHKSDRHQKWGAVFENKAAFRIPVPVDLRNRSFIVSFQYEPRFRQAKTVTFQYTSSSGTNGFESVDLQEARIHHDLPLEVSRSGGTIISIEVEVESPDPLDNHFRVHHIGLGMK